MTFVALVARALGQLEAGPCGSLLLPVLVRPMHQTKRTTASGSSRPLSSHVASHSDTEAGPSRPRTPSPQSARGRSDDKAPIWRTRQPALLRLDPSRPILPSLTPATERRRRTKGLKSSQARMKGLDRLHAALRTGSSGKVWSAYLSIREGIAENPLTPEECHQVLRVLTNDATKTKRGVHRVLSLISDVRLQQRRVLANIQYTSQGHEELCRRTLIRELEDWDRVISPALLTAAIRLIGGSLRAVGLDELDQVFDQVLTYEANERARLNRPEQDGPQQFTASTGSLQDLRTAIISPMAHSSLQKKAAHRRREPDFPDLATYNTILDIVTRTIHRAHPSLRSEPPTGITGDEDVDAMSAQADQHTEHRSADLSAALSSKLRRFDLDPDAAPLHVDELKRADRLFHSVLVRMQRKSELEPDEITYNIMVTMYCLLDRWDRVHGVFATMQEKRMVRVDAVNNALRHWLVHGPESARREEGGDEEGGQATETALEVYRQLRENLVQAELATYRSSVAYGGKEASTVTRDLGYGEKDDDVEPLSWPERNESPISHSARSSSTTTGNSAVEAILGISTLPSNIVPDEITHSILISTLAREGRFADALSVFKDLVSTPLQPEALDLASTEATELRMKPSLPIFDSFFRGFSRHGRPSTATYFDPDHPERSTWELVPSPPPSEDHPEESMMDSMPPRDPPPHATQLALWRIDAFQPIFDAFLSFEPEPLQHDTQRGYSDRFVATPSGWLSLAEKKSADKMWQAPSSNQLFWVLTAIRRVSHDHAGWSLAMWGKVVNKFQGGEWKDFRLDNRLKRVLQHLEGRLFQEENGVQDVDESGTSI